MTPPGTRTPPRPVYSPVTLHRRRRGRLVALATLLVLAIAVTVAVVVRNRLNDDSRRHYIGSDGWPRTGQAALQVGGAPAEQSPAQEPAPIASMAKVMTAYLVLRSHPLPAGRDGFRLHITAADVALTDRQRHQDQSLVSVAAGETLTERQALMALLLPSANNIAQFLARRVAGSVGRFVGWMNSAADSLGMGHTHYIDPSGFDAATVSTAADQLLLAREVARDDVFSAMAATRSFEVPVAGTIHNTDTLLGRDGFVGTKTGSHDAAGGCFMFRARRVVDGRRADVIGVVMGQHGHDLVAAGLYAARQLVDRVAVA